MAKPCPAAEAKSRVSACPRRQTSCGGPYGPGAVCNSRWSSNGSAGSAYTAWQKLPGAASDTTGLEGRRSTWAGSRRREALGFFTDVRNPGTGTENPLHVILVAAFGSMGRDEAADQMPVRLTILIFAAEYHLLGRLLQVVGPTD